MTKIRYRRPDKSDYSDRAVRALAKKYLLAMLADAIAGAAVCGYDDGNLISYSAFAERTADSTPRWQEGMRRRMDDAAMELLDEFRRRSEGK